MTAKATTKPRSTPRNPGASRAQGAGTPPSRPPQRVVRFKTLDDVRVELSKVYREARRGELAMDVAKGLAYLLQGLSAALRDTELERRIATLEAGKT